MIKRTSREHVLKILEKNHKSWQILDIGCNRDAVQYAQTAADIQDLTSFYKDKKYFEITFDSKDDIYENISLTFKNNDDEFTIYQLAGTISYKNIKQCLNQKKNIANELTKIFLNADKVDAGKRNYAADPSGKSKTYIEYFWLSEGGFVEVGCYDITEELANNNNWLKTSLSVGIVTKEFSDFLMNEQYN